MKTSGPVQARMRSRARLLLFLTLAFIGAVSLWTPFLQDGYYARWFSGWGFALAGGVALSVMVLTVGTLRALIIRPHDVRPFLMSLGIFAICFAGLGVSMFPYIVPTEVTLWEAAAPRNSQIFMLVGAAVLIPLILGYTAFSYWVFRGKVDPDSGYH
jgi:cytochrome d ubiquinol oxidase subunit II